MFLASQIFDLSFKNLFSTTFFLLKTQKHNKTTDYACFGMFGLKVSRLEKLTKQSNEISKDI